MEQIRIEHLTFSYGTENAFSLQDISTTIQKGQFVLIGPADAALREGQSVETQGQAFVVRRCQTRYLADEAVFVWALLVKAGGDEAWNS